QIAARRCHFKCVKTVCVKATRTLTRRNPGIVWLPIKYPNFHLARAVEGNPVSGRCAAKNPVPGRRGATPKIGTSLRDVSRWVYWNQKISADVHVLADISAAR